MASHRRAWLSGQSPRYYKHEWLRMSTPSHKGPSRRASHRRPHRPRGASPRNRCRSPTCSFAGGLEILSTLGTSSRRLKTGEMPPATSGSFRPGSPRRDAPHRHHEAPVEKHDTIRVLQDIIDKICLEPEPEVAPMLYLDLFKSSADLPKPIGSTIELRLGSS